MSLLPASVMGPCIMTCDSMYEENSGLVSHETLFLGLELHHLLAVGDLAADVSQAGLDMRR